MPASLSIEATAEQLAWLQNRDALRRYVVVLSPLKLSTETVVDFYFTDSVWSDAESAQYRPLLLGDIILTQSLPKELIGGSQSAGGKLSISNTSGEFDGWLHNYSWGGRQMSIYGSSEDEAWDEVSEYPEMYTGSIDRIEFTSSSAVTVFFSPESAGANLDIYGTTLNEEDIRWPMAYGRVYNIQGTPYTLEGVLDSQKIFKIFPDISNLTIERTDDVYVSGVKQTLSSGVYPFDLADLVTRQAALVAGEYVECLYTSMYAVHGTAAGAVTCDARGFEGAGGLSYSEDAGGIIRVIAQGAYAPSPERFPVWLLIDSLRIALEAEAPQQIGFYIETQTNVMDVVEEIVRSVGACYWWNNTSRMGLKVVTLPEENESQGDILESVDIIGDIAVQLWQAPVYKQTIRYNKNHTVQPGDGLPDVVNLPREFLQNEWREIIASDLSVSATHLDAQQIVTDTFMQKSSEAAAEASRLLELTKHRRFIYKLRAYNRCGGYALMDTWRLVHSRYAPAGKYLRVVSVKDNLTQQYTDLELWG